MLSEDWSEHVIVALQSFERLLLVSLRHCSIAYDVGEHYCSESTLAVGQLDLRILASIHRNNLCEEIGVEFVNNLTGIQTMSRQILFEQIPLFSNKGPNRYADEACGTHCRSFHKCESSPNR